MSLTKRSAAFHEWMEEARREDELSHERYREEAYLESTKQPADIGHKTKEDERQDQDGTTATRK